MCAMYLSSVILDLSNICRLLDSSIDLTADNIDRCFDRLYRSICLSSIDYSI